MVVLHSIQEEASQDPFDRRSYSTSSDKSSLRTVQQFSLGHDKSFVKPISGFLDDSNVESVAVVRVCAVFPMTIRTKKAGGDNADLSSAFGPSFASFSRIEGAKSVRHLFFRSPTFTVLTNEQKHEILIVYSRDLGYNIKSAGDPSFCAPCDFSKANTPAIYLLPSWRIIMGRTTSTIGMSDTRISLGHSGHSTESKATSCLKLPTRLSPRFGTSPPCVGSDRRSLLMHFQFFEGARVM